MSTTRDVYWTHTVNNAWTSNPNSEIQSHSFNFSGLTLVSMTIYVIMKFHSNASGTESRTFKISFKNTDGTNATSDYTATVNIATGEPTHTLSFSVNNASLASKPITYNGYIVAGSSTIWAYKPVIKSIVRTYRLTLPTSGESISHAGLKQYATWANMSTINHTTSNTVIYASESNRPWGTSGTLKTESGGSSATVASVAKSAGAKIEPSWIYTDAVALCDARNWSF